jgi:hypothetical protein
MHSEDYGNLTRYTIIKQSLMVLARTSDATTTSHPSRNTYSPDLKSTCISYTSCIRTKNKRNQSDLFWKCEQRIYHWYGSMLWYFFYFHFSQVNIPKKELVDIIKCTVLGVGLKSSLYDSRTRGPPWFVFQTLFFKGRKNWSLYKLHCFRERSGISLQPTVTFRN